MTFISISRDGFSPLVGVVAFAALTIVIPGLGLLLLTAVGCVAVIDVTDEKDNPLSQIHKMVVDATRVFYDHWPVFFSADISSLFARYGGQIVKKILGVFNRSTELGGN